MMETVVIQWPREVWATSLRGQLELYQRAQAQGDLPNQNSFGQSMEAKGSLCDD